MLRPIHHEIAFVFVLKLEPMETNVTFHNRYNNNIFYTKVQEGVLTCEGKFVNEQSE